MPTSRARISTWLAAAIFGVWCASSRTWRSPGTTPTARIDDDDFGIVVFCGSTPDQSTAGSPPSSYPLRPWRKQKTGVPGLLRLLQAALSRRIDPRAVAAEVMRREYLSRQNPLRTSTATLLGTTPRATGAAF